MRLPNPTTVVVSSGLWLLGMTAMAQPQSTAALVSFATQADVVLHEPVLLRLTIQNRLSEPIEVDLGWDRKGSLQLQVTRPDGAVIQPPGPAISGLSRRPIVAIPAGQAYSQQYILDERVSFDRPGTYELHLDLNASFRTTGGALLNPTTAAVLEVRVGARNAARLRQLCERLVQTAIKAPTYIVQSDAARALGYITDPVAVPCIESLFRATDRFDPFVTQALVRIGTDDARRALEEMFRSNDEDRFRRADDALRRFQQRDP